MEYGSAWFESAFEGRPQAVVASDPAAGMTAGELGERARSVAAAIVGDGCRIVGIELGPGCEWLVAVHGAWLAGAAVLPIDVRADSDARGARRSRCDVVIDGELPAGSAGRTLPGPDPLAPAAILYTSGTTLDPTEVMLSHGNLIAQGVASRAALGGSASDRWLSSLPVFHTGGLSVPVRCAVWGAEAVLRGRFDAGEAAALLGDPAAGVTVVSLVPTMLSKLLDAGLTDPPALRRAVVSGAPLSDELKQRALESGIPIVEAWGMTETTGMAAVERNPGDGGAGPALDGVHIEVSAAGEIRVGGATVAPGVTVGGMFDTGDLGHFESGSLVVDGRASSLIITGGHNVSPERVERVLGSHPGVAACLVSGVADAEWGELVTAQVVLRENVDDEALTAWCRERLSGWEVPRSFIRVASIELTESGKPRRGGGAG